MQARSESHIETNEHDEDEVSEGPAAIVARCVEELRCQGADALADQIQVLAGSASRSTFTVEEAAELANVSGQTIKNWISRGVITSTQPGKGRRHRIDRDSVLRAIDRRPEPATGRISLSTPESVLEYLSSLSPPPDRS